MHGHDIFDCVPYPEAQICYHAVSNCNSAVTDTTGIQSSADLPIFAGELQCFALGMHVDVADTVTGESIMHTGQPGELISRIPFPSEPVFWGDPDNVKLKAAYFDRFEHVWVHGDYIAVNQETKGIVMLGRSDGVLNPSGVRFGSAEIYAITAKFPEIQDALCVGQRRVQDKDERVLLFLLMKVGQSFSQDLVDQIKLKIRTELSTRHVPKYVFEVKDIPYTINGKKVEIAVKQIVSGLNIKISATVSNPQSLDHFKQYAQLDVAKL